MRLPSSRKAAGRIPAVLSVVVLCLVFSMVTQAALLSPGTNVPPDVFNLACGAPLATQTTSFTSTNNRVVASLTASVCADPSNPFGAGDLDFLYQLTNTAASLDGVGRITGINFTGWSVDAGYMAGTITPLLRFSTWGDSFP